MLGLAILIVWGFLGVWLLVFNAHDAKFEEFGILAFWGFLAPFMLLATLVELRSDLSYTLSLLCLLVTIAYMEWFEIHRVAILLIFTVMSVAVLISYAVLSEADDGIAKFVSDHYAEILIAAMALIALLGMFYLPYKSISY